MIKLKQTEQKKSFDRGDITFGAHAPSGFGDRFFFYDGEFSALQLIINCRSRTRVTRE